MVYQSKKKDPSYWITNISDRKVTLRDLSLSVSPRSSINLLSKHFRYTLDQIEASVNEGSIFAKSNMIKVRSVEPDPIKNRVIELSTQPRLGIKFRSNVVIIEPDYEELKTSDEKYADELADIFEEETEPAIKR